MAVGQRKKGYLLTTHSMLALSPTERVPWLDIGVHFRGKPARQPYELFPCLVGMASLESELGSALRDLIERPKMCKNYDWGKHEEKVAILELERLEAVRSGFVLRLDPYLPFRIAEVVTREPFIDREEAERMLLYMLQVAGLPRGRFRWSRKYAMPELGQMY